jgi:tetratricopeptide (TPR) repeat protein
MDLPARGTQVSDLLNNDLREQLARRQAVVVVGAGVAVAATDGAPTASWLGLLHDGVARCEAMAHDLPQGWGDRVRAQIDSGDVEALLSAAEDVTRRLDGPGGGEYRRWLRESVGSLTVTQPGVIERLADLGAPIVTTNYDNLIEEVSGLPTVTWRQGAQVQRVVRRDDLGVVHVHGHWGDPASVVLGIRSYERMLGDEHAQAVLHALTMLQSLVFVGFGAGLADPNFGALRAWLARVLAGSEYRHFRLGRNGDLARLNAEHDSSERIMVVGYGPKYSNLSRFLRTLAPPALPSRLALPPPPAWCFGRDAIVSHLVQALCAKQPVPTLVLGPPGVGKSTVCLAAVHHRRVAARFGERRWFVRCNAASTGEGLLAEVATTLGIPPGQDRTTQTLARLVDGPGLLVLDNAETPWEADVEGTEEALLRLASLRELRLLVTVRGAQRPFGVAWRESVLVTPLGGADGRRFFLAVAGQRFAGDPDLDELILAQDGVPLTIGLLANLVDEPDPNLSGLWRRWQAKRVALLHRGGGSSPQLSAEVSFEMSITSPRMTRPAHRLLSLLGVLPDGVAQQDLDVLLPENGGQGEEAASALRRVGLAFNEGSRLRVLQPIRDHVQHNRTAESDDLARAANHYRDLAAALGPKVGGAGGAEASSRLHAERGNLEAMIAHSLGEGELRPAIDAARALGEFMRFSGVGTPRLLEAAADAARKLDDIQLEADTLLQLGDIALRRSDHDAAGKHYEEARALYERVADVLGRANCIWGLGNIALRRSHHDTARQHYEQAQRLYEQGGNVRGQAECIWRIGDSVLRRSDRRSDYDIAQGYYEEARPLFSQVRDVLGQANCIRGLGNVALRRKEYDAARAGFEEAQVSYEQVGHIHGVATCIRGFGYIALEHAEYDKAKANFEAARPLFEQVASIHGRATCIQGLGDIALEYTQSGLARERFEEALNLYRRIPEPHGMGQTHQRLARLATSSDERDRHVQAARDAWNRIARADLVNKLDKEFDNT